MKNLKDTIFESCRRFIREEVDSQFKNRQVLVQKVNQRLDSHERRIDILEASDSDAPEKRKRRVKISGRLLANFRFRVGITQRELARLLGTTPAMVNRWEKERVAPGPQYTRKIHDLRKNGKKEILALLKPSTEAKKQE